MPEGDVKKREAPISYRPPKALREEFQSRVEKSGLSASAYITKAVFEKAPPRQSRRPPLEKKLLAQLLGQAARIRDELHEINTSESVDDTRLIEAAYEELVRIRAALLKAMGRKP